MKTGEGKTFVASPALYLNALPATGVHLVTVNDYLAKRDAEWNRGVFERLGMTVGFIQNMMPFDVRKAAYEADVTYGTNSEFGFDYLRDNMAVSLDDIVQRSHAFAIVDEVDSILIDEARTPLIISGEPETAASTYYDFARIARDLRGEPDDPQGRQGRGRDRALGRRLPLRREAQDRLAGADRARRGRARARHREPLRPAPRPARQPPQPGAEGRVALQARRRLRDRGRRGEDRRRVHRPDHGGPPLERGAAPGDRGEGGRRDPRGERHARDDHAAELLPPLREARRHDGHGEDGGEGVRRDLQPPRRRDPDERRRGSATTRTTSSSRPRKRSGTRSPRTSSSGTRRASPCSSARSPSRRPSTSPSC